MITNGKKLLSGEKVAVDKGIGRAPYTIMITFFYQNAIGNGVKGFAKIYE